MSPLQPSVRTLLCLLALLSFFSGGEVRGQNLPFVDVDVGDRVRVWTELTESGRAAGRRTTGQIVAFTGDSLVLHTRRGDVRTMPLGSIQRVDMSAGRRSRVNGLVRGAGFGVLVGGSLGAVVGSAVGREGMGGFALGEGGGPGGAVLGAGLGYLLGATLGTLRPGEVWRQVPMPAQVSVSPRVRRSRP
jgi:hypothetical protein